MQLGAGVASRTRGILLRWNNPSNSVTIDFVTIASTGNAHRFW